MPVKFVFLVLPGIHLMDLAGPDQTIHEAIDFGADFEIEYCGLDDETISSAGLHFKKQKPFSKIKFKPGDYLIIPGAKISYLLSIGFKSNKPLFDWIKTCHRQQVVLVSICSGAFVLAHCGLLDGIVCTTHFKQTRNLQAQYPKAQVNENILFTEANGIYTSAGIASGIDLLLYIIEKLKGGYFAYQVARELVIYNRRHANQEQVSVFMQFRNHIHSGIHRSQDYIIENIQKKQLLIQLAEIANMSERNFTRVFKKETGITVINYVNTIRKEIISQFSKNRDFSYSKIAKEVGLESEKQVRRILNS
ncbi:MAG: DJ-1/PfpI family protein [Chitinophagaceae bacterium]